MPDKRPLENGSAVLGEGPKRAKLVDAKGSAALVRQKLLALQNKIQSNPKLKALRSANQARIKEALEPGKPGGFGTCYWMCGCMYMLQVCSGAQWWCEFCVR